jgi:hypothetical protein
MLMTFNLQPAVLKPASNCGLDSDDRLGNVHCECLNKALLSSIRDRCCTLVKCVHARVVNIGSYTYIGHEFEDAYILHYLSKRKWRVTKQVITVQTLMEASEQEDSEYSCSYR